MFAQRKPAACRKPKLYRVTGDGRHLQAVRNLWAGVRAHHLTLGGGPWGGVAHRSREVFNPADVFSPEGYVETCSTMAWIQLNGELLATLGDAAFAQEIERSAYNDLLGAQAPNGEDWCYYSFPNGRRTHTTYWRCCKSSGAMALEELSALFYGVTANGAISINLLGASSATLEVPGVCAVRLRQETDYPYEGDIRICIDPVTDAEFAVQVRIPDWAEGAVLTVAGEEQHVAAGGFAVVHRRWTRGDILSLSLPFAPVVHHAAQRNVQESLAPGGLPVAQEVMRYDYVAVTKGPLVYATSLIDGFKVAETVHFDGSPTVTSDRSSVTLHPAKRSPIVFEPYYRVDDRRDGSWRLTWLGLSPRDE